MLSILVFQNAGINSPALPLDEIPLSDFQDVLNTNLIGPFLCARYAFRIFKRQSPQGGQYMFYLTIYHLANSFKVASSTMVRWRRTRRDPTQRHILRRNMQYKV